MKKFCLFIWSSLFLALAIPASAQIPLDAFPVSDFPTTPDVPPSTLSAQDYYDWGNYYLPEYQNIDVLGDTQTNSLADDQEELITSPPPPSSIFTQLGQQIKLFTTTDPLKKEEINIANLDQKLSQIHQLFKDGKTQEALKLLKELNPAPVLSRIDKIKEKGTDVSNVAEKLQVQAARHELLFQELLEKVPPSAVPAIKKAISNFQQQMDKAADFKGEPPLPPEVKERLESLQKSGTLTPQEVQSILNSPNRPQVRQELKTLMEESRLPEADFDKLNTKQKELFEKRFEKRQELRKIEELKKIEDSRPPEEIKQKLEQYKVEKEKQPNLPLPPGLKQWAPQLRREELENTIRPDLINEKDLPPRKVQEIRDLKEQFKPKPEELQRVQEWKEKNPQIVPPKHIQRIEQMAPSVQSPSPNHRPPQPLQELRERDPQTAPPQPMPRTEQMAPPPVQPSSPDSPLAQPNQPSVNNQPPPPPGTESR